MNKLYFRFLFDTEITSEKEKIHKNLHEKLIEIYSETAVKDLNKLNDIENATEFAFAVKIKCITREKCAFSIIRDAQKLGNEWVLRGFIECDFRLWSNKPCLIGINDISIVVDKKLPPKRKVVHK